MLLEVLSAKYIEGYQIALAFNDGYKGTVDLKDILMQEKRKIFQPLKDKEYFKNFSMRLNTICWENEADFAPEFLRELAERQQKKTVLSTQQMASVGA